MMQAVGLSPADIRSRGVDHVRRVLVLSIDGQGEQDSSVAQRRAVGGLFSLFGLIDRYNFETLTAVTEQVHALARAMLRRAVARRA
jgi:hypothetical protein